MSTEPTILFFNRELSWLNFNQRVLDEARNPALPVLERLKFLAITSSNLDEFFMVRVGGLQMLIEEGRTRPDPSGRTPEEQLREVLERAKTVAADQTTCFMDELEPTLKDFGIEFMRGDDFKVQQREHLHRVFREQIFQVISPMAVVPGTMPLLRNLTLHMAVRLKGEEPRFAIIPLEPGPARFMDVPADDGVSGKVLLEDAVRLFIDEFFTGEVVEETIAFRLTRNADMSVDDDRADLMAEMEEVLLERRTGQCVRLEVPDQISDVMLEFLCSEFCVPAGAVYRTTAPLDFKGFFAIAGMPGFERAKLEDWPPQPCADILPQESMFEAIARRDIMLHHPYESYDPVVTMIEEAANDPDVLAIKQVLYRVSTRSRVVSALERAAVSGKNVTVLIELKARFDEAPNIQWARQLELAGVQVIYGVRGLKTHAKICLIVRREPEGIRRYLHVGTGNYNESTARIYGDISILTADPDIGADASQFFHAITGYSQPLQYRKLTTAPLGLRRRFMDLIGVETEEARQGKEAWIMVKLNSLADSDIINALYEASQAGVKIALNIRGICTLRPGVKGLSENIRVVSIVDRFLEHSRIFFFHHGGDQRMFISSADWMGRNLDRRVELLIPVEDDENRFRLAFILQTYFKDNVNAWELQPDGTYQRLDRDGGKAFSCQRRLYSEVRDRYANAQAAQRMTFEPLRSN